METNKVEIITFLPFDEIGTGFAAQLDSVYGVPSTLILNGWTRVSGKGVWIRTT